MKKFIARQPIFDSGKDILGYEILFRSGPENYFNGNHNDASAMAVDNMLLFGIDRLTSNRLAFVNCSREFLLRDYLTLLPKDRVVGEILENIQVDSEILEACRRLKKLGYRLALDDFVETHETRQLLEMADYVKIDFLATPPGERRRIGQSFGRRNLLLIAEKIETHQEFQCALEMGYHGFQGYFFCRPQLAERREIPSSKLSYLRMLSMVNQPDFEFDKLAEIIKHDASLTYRLLRYLDSPLFGLRMNVRSIPNALALLGQQGVRRWISLVSIANMGEDKPGELIVLPLIRARFCEMLGTLTPLQHEAENLFLMGLLSAMDAIMDMPMAAVLANIPLEDEIKAALLGDGGPYRDILDTVLNYEQGNWPQLVEAAQRVKINEDFIPDLFTQSFDWARQVLDAS